MTPANDAAAPRLRVTHLITDLDVGGAEHMLLRLVETSSRDLAHTVVCMSGRGPLMAEVEKFGVDCIALDMRRGRAGPGDWWRARAALRRARPQVLQTWLYHADLLGTLLAPRVGRPALCWNIRTVDMDLARYNLLTRVVRAALARLSTWPDVIIANSVAGRDAHAALGYRPRRWCVIPNGFDLERFRPRPEARAALRARLGLAQSVPLIGMVARLDPAKDHAGLLRALARLGHRSYRCLLVGPGVPALAPLVATHGLARVVVLEDSRRDIEQVYAGLDLAILSSAFGEAFPNCLGEAMACGVPCVTTAVGDAPAIVGDSGLVVPRADERALAAAIEQALDWSAEERAVRGQAARARVAEHYALPAVSARYVALYRELAHSRMP